MPLVSIRPIVCGKHTGGFVPLIGDQIYRHLKNTPTEYHGVFSHPEKMFSMNLITKDTFRKIVTNLPNAFDKTKDYFINFALDNELWDLIPLSTPFSMERWMFIRDHYDTTNKAMIRFANMWIVFHLSPEKSKDLIGELLTLWKKRKWNTVANKKQIISIAQSFGVIGKEYSVMFQKELFDEEQRTKFKSSPLKNLSTVFKDLQSFSERTREMSYDTLRAMIDTTMGEITTKSPSSGYSSHSDCKFDRGYGVYDCGSDDDTLSPLGEDDDERLMFVMDSMMNDEEKTTKTDTEEIDL